MNETQSGGGALAGVTVLEIASFVSGPYASMLLADLGATVIKIEPPDGDPFRGWGAVDYSPVFGSLNRNKKSVMLDIKTPAGKAAVLDLASRADVFIENLRSGAIERAGLGYDVMRPANPRLIYCSITGFGDMGPYKTYPGFDTLGQAMSGLLSLLTSQSEPQPMGISLSDHLAGIFASYGILAALQARHRTGRGQRVQTSLLESSIAFLAESAANYLDKGGVAPDRETRNRQAQVYAFVARDEKPFVIHLSSPTKFWEGLLKATDMQSLAADPRFRDRAARGKQYDALKDILTGVFRGRDRDEWVQRLRDCDVPCSPLYDLKETFEDPQVIELGIQKTLPHPTRGSVTVIGSAVRLSDTPIEIVSAAQQLGADNDEFLGAVPN